MNTTIEQAKAAGRAWAEREADALPEGKSPARGDWGSTTADALPLIDHPDQDERRELAELANAAAAKRWDELAGCNDPAGFAEPEALQEIIEAIKAAGLEGIARPLAAAHAAGNDRRGLELAHEALLGSDWPDKDQAAVHKATIAVMRGIQQIDLRSAGLK